MESGFEQFNVEEKETGPMAHQRVRSFPQKPDVKLTLEAHSHLDCPNIRSKSNLSDFVEAAPPISTQTE